MEQRARGLAVARFRSVHRCRVRHTSPVGSPGERLPSSQSLAALTCPVFSHPAHSQSVNRCFPQTSSEAEPRTVHSNCSLLPHPPPCIARVTVCTPSPGLSIVTPFFFEILYLNKVFLSCGQVITLSERWPYSVRKTVSAFSRARTVHALRTFVLRSARCRMV